MSFDSLNDAFNEADEKKSSEVMERSPGENEVGDGFDGPFLGPLRSFSESGFPFQRRRRQSDTPIVSIAGTPGFPVPLQLRC